MDLTGSFFSFDRSRLRWLGLDQRREIVKRPPKVPQVFDSNSDLCAQCQVFDFGHSLIKLAKLLDVENVKRLRDLAGNPFKGTMKENFQLTQLDDLENKIGALEENVYSKVPNNDNSVFSSQCSCSISTKTAKLNLVKTFVVKGTEDKFRKMELNKELIRVDEICKILEERQQEKLLSPVETVVLQKIRRNQERLRQFWIMMNFDNGEVYEQEKCKFVNLPTGVEFEVIGEPCKVVAVPAKFSANDMAILQREVVEGTTDMEHNLSGLASAPRAVGLVKALTILAACSKDPSLVNDKTKDFEFKLIKIPRSFRATLVQVINSITDAFLFADAGMNKIRVNMTDVPALLAGSMEAICHPEDPAVKKILEMNKKRIADVSVMSSTVSTSIADKFEEVRALIQELQMAAEATQTHSDDELSKLKKLQEEYKCEQMALKEEQEKLEGQLRRQQKLVDDALAEYKEKSANLGHLGKLAAACLADVCVDAARTVVSSVKDLSGTVTDTVKNLNPLRLIQDAHGQANHNLGKSYEKSFHEFLTAYLSLEFDSAEELEKNCEDIKGSFEPFMKFAAVSPQGKNVEMIARNFLKQLDAFSSYDIPSYEKVKGLHNQLKVAVEVAVKARQDKNASKVKKAEIATGLMNSMTAAATEARNSYTYERNIVEEMHEKDSKMRLELAKLGANLKNIDMDTVDLNDIIKYLSQGLVLLTSVKESWTTIAQFFKSVETVVNGPMKTNFDQFLECMNDDSNSDLIKKKLMSNAVKACGIVFQVSNCALIYRDISQKYVIPEIAVVQKNLQMDKKQAQAKLGSIDTNFKDLENELSGFIEGKKNELLKNHDEQLQLYTEPLKLAITD